MSTKQTDDFIVLIALTARETSHTALNTLVKSESVAGLPKAAS